MPNLMEIMVNNTLANSSHSGSSIPSQVSLPKANQVDQQQFFLQQMQSMIDQSINKSKNINNAGNRALPPNITNKPTNCTGRVYGAYCPNCGVMLLPNKCAAGCVRIKKGHQNIPFPYQAVASTITFENRHNHPGASNNKASKYGKKWEDVTDPRVLARL